MRCSGCTLPLANANDVLEFKYVWFNSGYSTTTCRDKQVGSTTANNGIDMAKWDDPAMTAANRAANVWGFAYNINKLSTLEYGGPQTFDVQVPLTQATSYPRTPWNAFNVDLIDALSRYQQFGSVLISASDNFNIESVLAKVALLEPRLADKPAAVAGAPPYNMGMTNAFRACNQGLMMACQALSPEKFIDYILRLFGYTVFLQILFVVIILLKHAIKKARSSGTSGNALNAPLLQNAYGNHP